MIEIVKIAAAKSGSVTALARELGIPHTNLYAWRRVPAHHAQTISRITRWPLYKIRPDVYTEPKPKTKKTPKS